MIAAATGAVGVTNPSMTLSTRARIGRIRALRTRMGVDGFASDNRVDARRSRDHL